MFNLIKGLIVEESGQGMAEYGLILALVAVLLIGALGLLKDGIGTAFEKVTDALEGTTPSQ